MLFFLLHIKIEDFDFDNILLNEISRENILVYDIYNRITHLIGVKSGITYVFFS